MTTEKKPVVDLALLGDLEHLHATRDVQLKHPDRHKQGLENGGKPIIIHYCGVESDEYTEAVHYNRRQQNQRMIEGEKYDPQFEEDAAVRTLAYCTRGWDHVPRCWLEGGKDESELPFTRENAFNLYKRLGWVRNQVQAAIWKREPFDDAS
jgi:hypothetical protein